MNDPNTPEPLVFKNQSDLRNKLMEVYEQGGMEAMRKYLNREFIPHRTLRMGANSAQIYDFELNTLKEGKPERTLMGFKKEPTVENSMLMMTVNLIDTTPHVQLLIRKEL